MHDFELQKKFNLSNCKIPAQKVGFMFFSKSSRKPQGKFLVVIHGSAFLNKYVKKNNILHKKIDLKSVLFKLDPSK